MGRDRDITRVCEVASQFVRTSWLGHLLLVDRSFGYVALHKLGIDPAVAFHIVSAAVEALDRDAPASDRRRSGEGFTTVEIDAPCKYSPAPVLACRTKQQIACVFQLSPRPRLPTRRA